MESDGGRKQEVLKETTNENLKNYKSNLHEKSNIKTKTTAPYIMT